jgi:two-component system, NtrC family, nitrogen regulation sensor histidine kinase NtrY
MTQRRRRALRYAASVLIVIPAATASILALSGLHAPPELLLLVLLSCVVTAAFPLAYDKLMQRRLDSLANVLHAIRFGDHTLRARIDDPRDATHSLAREINQLRESLAGSRVAELGAAVLTHTIVDCTSIAIVTFDELGRLRSINPAAEQLVGINRVRSIGRHAAELGFAPILEAARRHLNPVSGSTQRQFLIRHQFARVLGTWDVRCAQIRVGHFSAIVVLLSDISQTLSNEQRESWDRLVRVLSHELNNSLAAIQSLSSSIVRRFSETEADARESVPHLAGMIEHRAQSLVSFLDEFAKQQRLPAPVINAMSISEAVRHATATVGSARVDLSNLPDRFVHGDRAQLEQALINVIRNAVEALGPDGCVSIRITDAILSRLGSSIDAIALTIDDDGPGISSTDSLFVPFFSTKVGGSGIGLMLAKRIVESHHGTLSLTNRQQSQGARVEIILPVALP